MLIKNSPERFVPDELRDALYTTIRRVEIKELDRANTVCISLMCTEIVVVSDIIGTLVVHVAKASYQCGHVQK